MVRRSATACPPSPRWACATRARGLARALSPPPRATPSCMDRRTLRATIRGSAHVMCEDRDCVIDVRHRCKGADKVRQWAHNLRRPAHRPGAPPPPPVPLSPPYARATLVPRRAAVLSPRKQARCPVRIGAPYLPQQEDRRTLSAPSGACYAPHDLNLCVGPAHLMCILTSRHRIAAPYPAGSNPT